MDTPDPQTHEPGIHEPEIHYHDRGPAFDMTTLVHRRSALGLLAGVATVWIVAQFIGPLAIVLRAGPVALFTVAVFRWALAAHGIEPIDLLIVNLYPFEQTVAAGADRATCIENIDIGGPAMIRAAAKNHRFVTVVTDPMDYDCLLATLKANDGATSMAHRQKLALTAYAKTADYDTAV